MGVVVGKHLRHIVCPIACSMSSLQERIAERVSNASSASHPYNIKTEVLEHLAVQCE